MVKQLLTTLSLNEHSNNPKAALADKLILDLFTNQHRMPAGRRWSQQSKDLITAMHIASPAATKIFTLNIASPSASTIGHQIRLHRQPMAYGLQEAVLRHVAATFASFMKSLDIPAGRLLTVAGIDDSPVTSCIRHVPSSTTVVGLCGPAATVDVPHACNTATQALELRASVLQAKDGFQALQEFVGGYMMATRVYSISFACCLLLHCFILAFMCASRYFFDGTVTNTSRGTTTCGLRLRNMQQVHQ